jgi:hypothetical protein
MITNEEFLKGLDQDYPNQDWDAIPSLDSFPNVYIVNVQKQIITRHVTSGKTIKKLEWTQIATEFPTRIAAEEYVEKMKPVWSKVNFIDDSLTWRQKLVWHGPYLLDSIKIQEKKPEDAVALSVMADLRKQVLAGEKVFPMYLP